MVHCDGQAQERAQSEVYAGTSQVDFEVDRPPPAACPPGDLLITIVKKTVHAEETNNKQ